MDFNNLNMGKTTTKSVVVLKPRQTNSTLGVNTVLSFDNLMSSKKSKLTKEQLALIEPGNKIPIANYKQIGMLCEECNDIHMHVYIKEKNQVMCMNCKTITK